MLRSLRLKFAAALTALGLAGTAQAQSTYTWNLNAAGNWDTATNNWLLLGVPAPWSNGNNTAVFGDVITASRTITLSTGITANALNFTESGSFVYSLTGGTLALTNSPADPSITVGSGFVGTATYSGTGGHTVSTPLTYAGTLNLVNNAAFGTTNLTISTGGIASSGAGGIAVSGQGNTSISAAIASSVTGGITKTGTGTLNLSSSLNAFTGGVSITGGVLSIASSDAALGNSANGVSINGGTLRFTSSVTVPSTRVLTIGASGGGIDLAASATATIASPNLLQGSGPLLLSLTGGTTAGNLAITVGAQSYSGAVTVGTPAQQLIGSAVTQRIFSPTNSTTLTLGGTAVGNTGSLASASSLTVNNSAALTITQPTTAATGRLGATAPLTFNSGRFLYTGSSNLGNAISESFGAVTVTGLMTITGSGTAGPAAGTTLTFAGLTRTDNAMLAFRAPQNGTQGTFGGATASTSQKIFFTGLTPDTTTSGTTRSIVPWAGNLTTLTSNDIQNFMTYDANGFRPLSLTTEVVLLSTANTLAAAATGVNIRTTGSGLTQTIATGGQTINSYSAASAQTIVGNATVGAPGNVLTITSGGLATFNTITVTDATINFPNGAYFNLGFPFAFGGNSRITGTSVTVGAFNGSSSYALRLTNTPTGGNTFYGGLFVNGNAAVNFTLNNQLGKNTNATPLDAGGITLGGGQLLFLPATGTTVSLNDGAANRTIAVNASNGTIGTATAAAVLQIPGVISGAGQVQFGGGSSSNPGGIVELTNTAANTYTGGTLISSGILRLSNSNQLGTGAVLINGGTLQASGTLTFAAAPIVVVSSTIDTQDNAVTLAGLNGSGGTLGTSATSHAIFKSGAGTLVINGTGNYAGTLTTTVATGGAITISGNGRLPELGTVTISRGTAFNVDDSSAPIADRTGRAANLTLANGGTLGGATVNLTTNAGGSNFRFGTLTVSGGAAAGTQNDSFLNILDSNTGNNIVRFLSFTNSSFNVLNIVGSSNLGLGSASGSRILFDTTPVLSGGILANVKFTGSDQSGGTVTNAQATYDPVFGVIAVLATTGTVLDNINAPITAKNFIFTTSGSTTANLGASIKSITVAGPTLTLVNAGYTPVAANDFAPADTLILNTGGLSSSTAGSLITSTTPTVIRFGVAGATTANIVTTLDLTIGANVTLTTTGGLTKTGTSTLTINGANTITGAYDLSGGQTILPATGTTAASLTGSGALNFAGLILNGSATTTFSGNLTGTSGASITTALGFTGIQTLSGANTQLGAITLNGGTLVAGSASALGNVNNGVIVGPNASLGFSGSVTISAINPVGISGTGAAGRSGAIDNISGTNSFAGPITISGSATLGTTAGTLTLSGGISGGSPTFNPTGSSILTLTTVALNIGTSALSKTGTGTLVLPNLANTLGNANIAGGLVRASADNNLGATTNALNLSNGGGFQYGAVFTLDPARTITVGTGGGAIDTNNFTVTLANPVGGTGGLVKSGTGTLTLTSASTYGGSTTVALGTLTAGLANSVPSGTALIIGSPASSVVATFNTGGFAHTFSSITIFAQDTSLNPALVVGTGTTTINGSISLVDTVASAGNRFGAAITGTGTLDLGGGVRTISVASQNNNTNPGDFQISPVITNGGITFIGVPSTLNGSATGMTLNSAVPNTYTLGTNVNAGTLNVASTSSLGTGPVVINQTGTVASAIALNSSLTIGSLSTSTVATSSLATLSIASATTLTVNQTTNGTFAGVISGAALTKTGGGTLILSGANTYTGNTTVNAGVLQINGTSTGSAITVTGGTLRGSGNGTTGRINGSVSISAGGTLAGGNGTTGTLTLAGAGPTFSVGSFFGVGITDGSTSGSASSGTSSGTVSGGVYPSNTFINKATGTSPSGFALARYTIDLNNLAFNSPDGVLPFSYILAGGMGDLTGGNPSPFTLLAQPGSFAPVGTTVTAGPFTFLNVNAGVTGIENISLTGTNTGMLYLNFTPTPEPMLLLGLGAIGVALLRRRK